MYFQYSVILIGVSGDPDPQAVKSLSVPIESVRQESNVSGSAWTG